MDKEIEYEIERLFGKYGIDSLRAHHLSGFLAEHWAGKCEKEMSGCNDNVFLDACERCAALIRDDVKGD